MAQTKVKLISDGVIVQGNLHASHGITTAHIGEGSNLYYTDARVGSYLSSNGYATQSTIVAAITDSAPSTLDTLNELAAALGDDVNFSTTVTNSIATKMPLAGGTFTGDISIPDKMIHSGDTNTYLSFSGADNIKLVAGGKNVLHAHDNGNLYLYGNNGTALTLDGSQNATFAGDIQAPGMYVGSTNTSFDFYNNGTSYFNGAVTIDDNLIISSGNVGIGTTSPAAKLDVRNAGQGGIELWPEGLAVSGTNLINNYDRTGDNFVDFEIRAAQYNWKIGTSSKMVMLSSGKVGIGTTSPAFPLDVSGIIRSNTSNVGYLYLGNTNQTTIAAGAIIAQRSPSYAATGKLLFKVPTWGANTDYGLTTQMSIEVTGADTKTATMVLLEHGGKVGIGTTSPQNILHLKSNDPKLILEDGNAGTNEKVYAIYPAGSQYVLQTMTDAHVSSNNIYVVDRTGTTIDSQKWYTTNSGIMTLYDGGRLYPNGGVFLGSSNNSNLLDDYEEGSFTPGAYYQNATDQGNTTDNTSIGQYVKIGATVTVWIKLNWTITGSPVNDNVGIKNLPFQGTTTASNASIAVFLKNVSAPILQRVPTNSQTIALFMGTDYSGNYGNEIGAGTHEIATCFTYLTDQ